MHNIQEVIATIEALETDSFAKFYIYSAVLKMIGENSDKQHDRPSFEALLPAYNLLPGIISDCPLNIGQPQPEFYTLIKAYSVEIKCFTRNKAISDLLCILEKMLSHLKGITKESTKQNNASFGAISFECYQNHVENYLTSAVELNRARHMLFYKLVGTAFVLLIVLQVTVGSPILLGLAVNAMSILLAYGFMLYTKQDLSKKRSDYVRCSDTLKDQKKKFGLHVMYDRFFAHSILTPVDQTTHGIKRIMPIAEEKIEEKIPDVPCFRR